MGGYTYYKNSRLNRLTAWNNNGVTDVPSEVIYLVEEETKKKWSLGLNPMPDAQIYQVTYGFGYAKYAHESCGIEQEMLIFVPEKDPVKVQILTLKNKEPRKRELKVVYYLKPVLDEDEIKSHHFLDLSYDKKRNAIFFQNQIQMDAKQVGYVATSEPIQTYTGDRNCFFGKGNLADPEGLKKVFLDSSNSLFREGRIVLEMNVEIEAFEEKELILLLGCEEEKEVIEKKIEYYTKPETCQEEFRRVKRYWEEMLRKSSSKNTIGINESVIKWMEYVSNIFFSYVC